MVAEGGKVIQGLEVNRCRGVVAAGKYTTHIWVQAQNPLHQVLQVLEKAERLPNLAKQPGVVGGSLGCRCAWKTAYSWFLENLVLEQRFGRLLGLGSSVVSCS